MEANKILSADVLDLIFEDRNKDYGAYQLRKTYNRRILRALLITASIAVLALLGSFLASKFKSDSNKPDIKQVTIADLKPEEDKPCRQSVGRLGCRWRSRLHSHLSPLS